MKTKLSLLTFLLLLMTVAICFGQKEKANARDNTNSSIVRGASIIEDIAEAHGKYVVECRDKNGKLRWRDVIDNVVTTEGKNAALTHIFKGSSYTAAIRMGLITSTGYSAPDATNTAAQIATSSSANGWEEAPTGSVAARGTPTMGTASAGSLATSSNVSFSVVGTDVIKGIFILIKSSGGTDPNSTVGNTGGALWSAGVFSGGDKTVGNGDTLSVGYTTSL